MAQRSRAKGKKPRFSIVIETANERDGNDISLAKSLETIMRQAAVLGNPEIVVVDCTRTNHIKNLLKKYPKVKRVTKKGANYFECKNYGFKHTTGDIVLFIDSDCVLDPGWFQEAKKTFKRKDIDFCNGVTHYPLNTIFRKAMSVHFYPVGHFQINKRPTVSGVGIRREVFAKYPFPEGMIHTRASKSIMSWRLYRDGYKLYTNPKMEQTHNFSPQWIQKRLRIAYDCIAVRQNEPTFPQASMLRWFGILFPFLWYPATVLSDWKHAIQARRVLKIRPIEMPGVLFIIAGYRMIDVFGMEVALFHPGYFKKRYGTLESAPN